MHILDGAMLLLAAAATAAAALCLRARRAAPDRRGGRRVGTAMRQCASVSPGSAVLLLLQPLLLQLLVRQRARPSRVVIAPHVALRRIPMACSREEGGVVPSFANSSSASSSYNDASSLVPLAQAMVGGLLRRVRRRRLAVGRRIKRLICRRRDRMRALRQRPVQMRVMHETLVVMRVVLRVTSNFGSGVQIGERRLRQRRLVHVRRWCVRRWCVRRLG